MAMSKHKTEIAVALIGAVATLVAALVSRQWGKEEGLSEAKRRVTLQVNVFNASSSSGIADALVRLSGDGVGESRQTDSTGRVTFDLPSEAAERLARVQAEAANFETKSEELRLVSGYKQHDIRLRPNQPIVANPAPTPSDSVKVQRVFSSGPRLSGSGADFSDWYTLCSEGLPAHARIVNVSFALSGDRRCGSWANCRESERSTSRACYQFQMQGHNEWPGAGQASSEGILTVEYVQGAG